jgi:hypothetical protein
LQADAGAALRAAIHSGFGRNKGCWLQATALRPAAKGRFCGLGGSPATEVAAHWSDPRDGSIWRLYGCQARLALGNDSRTPDAFSLYAPVSQQISKLKLEPKKGGDLAVDWKNLSREDKAKYLDAQLEQIRQARALIERFEALTQKWLRNAQAQEGKKQS